MLRALRFMDTMIQRDTMQKAAFLNDLATFWHKFDDRVLRLKVCLTRSFNMFMMVLLPIRITSLPAQLFVTCAPCKARYPVFMLEAPGVLPFSCICAVAVPCCLQSGSIVDSALHMYHCC